MWLGRLRYFISKTYESMLLLPGLCVLGISSMTVCLFLLGMYIMLLHNFANLALLWGQVSSITCYLDDAKEHWAQTHQALQALPQVARADFLTPQAALDHFVQRGPEAAALVEGVTADILPPSVELFVRGGFTDLRALHAVAAAAQSMAHVESVDFGQQEFEQLAWLVRVLRFGGAVFGLFLIMVSAVVVGNTIRLTVYARRDEIAILRLVGATSAFISGPFLLEGALWGLLGGFLGSVGLLILDYWVAPGLLHQLFADSGLSLKLFAWPTAVGLVGGGCLLGLCSSALALRRFLSIDV